MRRAPGPRQLVTLPGEPHELDLAIERAEHREQLLTLVDRTAEVVLGVQDQQGRGDLCGVCERRDRAVHLGRLPRVGADVALEEPADVARAVLRRKVVDGALRYRAPEPVRVPDD